MSSFATGLIRSGGSENRNQTLEMIGDALILASIQFSIGSVEMSSKFSVKNFSKSQEVLNNAADALAEYLKIAFIWTFGIALLMYLNFGLTGIFYSVGSNAVVVYWIYHSYYVSFAEAAKENNLILPSLRFFR